MNWEGHDCEFEHRDGRLRNEDEVLSGIRRRLGADADGDAGSPAGGTGSVAPGDDPQMSWPEALSIAGIGGLATGTLVGFDTGISQLPVAFLAGVLVAVVAAMARAWRSLARVLIAEVSAVSGVLTWTALDGTSLEVRLVVVGLVVVATGAAVFVGVVAVSGRADYAVWRLINSATIAVAWWSALQLSFDGSSLELGLRAGLYGVVAVLGLALLLSLLDDVRLWVTGRTTGEAATDLLNQLDRIVHGLSVLRTVGDPSRASELRLGLLEPTERAARLVERQLGRSLSRQAAREASRRVVPYVTTRGWLRADLALRGEAIRQWRRDLALPERDNADRLRGEVIHIMAHVERWEWLGIPTVRGADPATHRRRRRVGAVLVSAVLFAPLVLLITAPVAPWDIGSESREQLLAFALPLAVAGIAVASGALNLRDLSAVSGAGPSS